MKKKWIILLLFAAAAIILFFGIRIYKSTLRAEALTMKELDDTDLKRTMVSPHMEQQLVSGSNTMYCSTFQLCWNELKSFMKGDIELSGDPDIVPFLNKSLSTKEDLSEKSYVAEAGFVGDDLEAIINKQMDSKFQTPKHVDFKSYSDDDIVAYAYLYKNLKFKEEFECFDEPMMFFEGNQSVKVKAFGIEDYSSKKANLGKQVEIIDYKNDQDFILKLTTTSADDEIILALVEPQATLLETIEKVDDRIATGVHERLRKNDTLMIPKFSFNLTHEFRELQDKQLLNPGYTEYMVAEAIQDITFVLDERGAVLESSAKISLKKGIEESRYLAFNKPFLLFMKEEGAEYPYFAIWIENTELMAKGDIE